MNGGRGLGLGSGCLGGGVGVGGWRGFGISSWVDVFFDYKGFYFSKFK